MVLRQRNKYLVPVTSLDQQACLSRHRVREGCKVDSPAIGNRCEVAGHGHDHLPAAGSDRRGQH